MNRKMRAKLANRIARTARQARECSPSVRRTPTCPDCGEKLVPVRVVTVLEPVTGAVGRPIDRRKLH